MHFKLDNQENTTANNIKGFGLGLRSKHYQDILTYLLQIDFLEIITENYLVDGGSPLFYLKKIAKHYPIVMHCVSMSLGSMDKFDKKYLQKVYELKQEIGAVWISDHVCWTGIAGKNTHDLLPIPFTEEALEHLTARVQEIQDFFQEPILLENPASYINYCISDYSEWEFLNQLTKKSGCFLLLDINNIYVNACNHNFCAQEFITNINAKSVKQIHLAGHSKVNQYCIDTHCAPVMPEVLSLYRKFLDKGSLVPTMIERDENIPELADLIKELNIIKKIAKDET